ncbi:MAG TPA: substrate-binding domain-containing protein [Bacteroidia bacterium]|nr:substrate-binding domain-containing protein [Bacteroidia bacterium]
MKMKINSFLFPAVFSFFFFSSCNDSQTTSEEVDTPTTGKVRLSIDENIRPLADELVDAFENSYPDAFLIQSYSTEKNVMQDLYADSSRLAIMTRQLTAKEIQWFEAQKYGVEQIKIGSDAVVFLVNKNNSDSIFTVDQIRKMISGEDSLWSQIRPDSKLGRINIVFDNTTSSNLRYLTDTLLAGKNPGKNCFALTTNDSVVGYVNANENSIGVVGLNWLGDKDSEEDMARRNKVILSAIGKDSTLFAHPDQSAMVTGAYPFTRGIWIVKIGKRAGLGTGFASFSLGDRGQLIVQRAGLVPAKPAERKVQINIQ